MLALISGSCCRIATYNALLTATPAGERERFDQMWMSGELMAIYEREAIANLRRCGKHDLDDHYERAMAAAGPPAPVDYVGEEMRSLGFEWPPA